MYQDYKDLLSAFHAHGVRFLIVGGYAVIYHSQPRYTKDLDLFIQADPANALATFAALAKFGAPLQGIRPDIPGVNFDAAWEHRVDAVIDQSTGLKAPFISRDDLIASKLASGRLQDLADVDHLRTAALSITPKAPPQ